MTSQSTIRKEPLTFTIIGILSALHLICGIGELILGKLVVRIERERLAGLRIGIMIACQLIESKRLVRQVRRATHLVAEHVLASELVTFDGLYELAVGAVFVAFDVELFGYFDRQLDSCRPLLFGERVARVVSERLVCSVECFGEALKFVESERLE